MQKISTEEVIVPDVATLAIQSDNDQAEKALFANDHDLRGIMVIDPCDNHIDWWCPRCRATARQQKCDERKFIHSQVMILMDDASLTPQQLRQAIGKVILA